MNENKFILMLKYGLLRSNSPYLLTSGSLRNRIPQYREVVIRGLSLASLEMKHIDMTKYVPFSGHHERLHPVSSVSFEPGCELITLRAHNGQYICAESGGNKELFANRIHPGEWEVFELAHLERNRVALKAVSNSKFIRAEGGGGGRLRPDRHLISDHETFVLESKGSNKIALRAHNGKYVCAEDGGGRELVVNRDRAREWETFKISKAPLYAPSLIAPKNGTVYRKEQRIVTLRWGIVAGTIRYSIEVEAKKNTGWSLFRSSKKIKRTQYRLNVHGFLVPSRWRVWAIDSGGNPGPKSDWWYFEFHPNL